MFMELISGNVDIINCTLYNNHEIPAGVTLKISNVLSFNMIDTHMIGV